MNIREATEELSNEAYRTGKPTMIIVREQFASLGLSSDDIDILAMDGLAAKINALLTGGTFRPEHPNKQITIQSQDVKYAPTREALAAGKLEPTVVPPPPIKISVDVEILHNTQFEVYGVRKPIIDFTGRDLDYMLELYDAAIDGYSARSKVFSYAKERLKKLGKTKISSLAVGEQTILARKWKAATKLAESAAVA